MNIDRLKQGNFKEFSKLKAPLKKKQIEAVGYIEFLAQRMGVDIKDWDITKSFKDSKNESLITTDRNKINKTFFVLTSKNTVQNKSKVKSTNKFEKMKTQIGKALKSRHAEKLSREQCNLGNSEKRLKSIKKEEDETIKNILTSKDIINKIKSSEDVDIIFNDILNALKGGFWAFKTIQKECVELVTATDIVVTQKKPAAHLDIKVNLGKFKAKVRLSDLKVTVHRYENNIVSGNSYYHPYVYRDGSICFGNATDFVRKKRSEGDLGAILNTLAALLTTYSSSTSPVESLDNFTYESNRRKLRRRR